MKQKYVVLLDSSAGRLSIQEFAELDKEMLSLLCEETYDAQTIKAAMEKDRTALIQAIRTHNMYPPGAYTERIADAITEMFNPGANPSTELFFEERELFDFPDTQTLHTDEDDEKDEDADEGALDVDDLLDDDIEDDFEDKGMIKDFKKTIQTSDDDDSDDDT